jgi:hypothetical protein
MHNDNIRRKLNRFKSVPDGRRPEAAADNHSRQFCDPGFGNDIHYGFDLIFRNCNDDIVDRVARLKTFKCMDQYGFAAKQHKLFWDVRSESCSTAGCDDYGCVHRAFFDEYAGNADLKVANRVLR